MKLWLLEPIKPDEGFWSPWFDKAFGFVVRATTENDARAFAEEEHGDEGEGQYYGPVEKLQKTKRVQVWLDPSWTSCVELTAEGEEGVVLKDFRSA